MVEGMLNAGRLMPMDRVMLLFLADNENTAPSLPLVLFLLFLRAEAIVVGCWR